METAMHKNGFSLIELLIVIAIIGIFSVFTYPGYRDSVTRARRVDGQTALLELANQMEHYYSKDQSYQNATLGTGKETDVRSSNHSAQNWYFLQITNQSDSDFSLEAIPIRAQAIDDTSCQTLTFNSSGVKGIKAGPLGNPIAAVNQCW